MTLPLIKNDKHFAETFKKKLYKLMLTELIQNIYIKESRKIINNLRYRFVDFLYKNK